MAPEMYFFAPVTAFISKGPCQHDGQSRGQRAACAVRIVRLNSFAFIDMEIAAVIEDIHRIFHAVAALHEDCLAAQKGELAAARISSAEWISIPESTSASGIFGVINVASGMSFVLYASMASFQEARRRS